MKIVLTTLNAKYIHSSLALRLLYSCCRDLPVEMTLKEYTINHRLSEVLEDLFDQQPDVLAIACYIWNIESILALCSLVKKVLPQCKIVLGGPEVTYDAQEILQENPSLDFVVQGEGEWVLKSLLQALADQLDLVRSPIPGLAFRVANGEIVVSEPQVVANLSEVPFAYTEEDMAVLANRIIYFESSRGCPFSCQYCLSGQGNGVRHLSLERVFAALDFFLKHKVKQVKFVDRTFNTWQDHYLPILKYIKEHPSSTNFHFEIAIDILPDSVIEFLQDLPVGQMQFEIGVQSTFEPALKSIQRHNDWAKISAKVKRLRQFNCIHLHLDLIAGLPFETYDDFSKSFNDVYQLNPHMLQLGFLKLLKGSGIRQSAHKHDYIWTDQAPYEVLANRYISYSELRQLKQIEELVDRLHNSGRFSHTLRQLISWRSNQAFEFFEVLVKLWRKQDRHKAAQGPLADYELLTAYALAEVDSSEKQQFVQNLLKLDALLHQDGKAQFLPWNEQNHQGKRGDPFHAVKDWFWRSDLLLKIKPDFKFKSWRDLKKNWWLEIFEQNVTQTWQADSAPVALLFQYEPNGLIKMYQLQGLGLESDSKKEGGNKECISIEPIQSI